LPGTINLPYNPRLPSIPEGLPCSTVSQAGG
jgi:hypothetical protein